MSWDDREKLHREIIQDNIERDSVGSRLTPQAKRAAIDFALEVWKGQMGNGEATQIGIKHAIRDVLKK